MIDGGSCYLRFALPFLVLLFSSASRFFSASPRTWMDAMTKALSRRKRFINLDGSQPHFCKQK